ncbi:MAG: mismatch repair protein MutS protein [candidate division TM6 bacterium GW2011_GWF2_38_10]|nr:MAG: mismatch repair protein MutS protein [candidate division TM6 bacterium GW2011_GWF2_38_10]
MEQYFTIKSQYPDALLLFQVGDFYELFFEDAQKAAATLAITLTKRGKNKGVDVPLCGIPVHALNHYVPKLIRQGYRVAVCDQLTKPMPGTVVQRGVTHVFTPGTLTDQALLDEKTASYLLSFFPCDDQWALVFSELLTAQLFATTVAVGEHRLLEAELARFSPDEILIPTMRTQAGLVTYFGQLGYCTTPVIMNEDSRDDYALPSIARAVIEQQFSDAIVQQLRSKPALNGGMEQLFGYLHKHQQGALEHFKSVHFYEPDDYLLLDAATQKNLDLVVAGGYGAEKQSGGAKTLFAVMDGAKTAMGSRTIKKWILRPLMQRVSIEQRLDVVSALVHNVALLQAFERTLGQVADLERIIGRIALDRATVADYKALRDSLLLLGDVTSLLSQLAQLEPKPQLAMMLVQKIADFSSLITLLQSSLNDDPAVDVVIKSGFNPELDRLRHLLAHSHQDILALESCEVAATGIASLKIGFTDLSGYYIEVTQTHLAKIPERYVHKQTLSNRQRFTTPELKGIEADLFKARNELGEIEKEVFARVKQNVRTYLSSLRLCAQALAYLDGLFGFAWIAYHNHYVRPTFNDKRSINIVGGRHPVVAQNVGAAFIPNNTQINDQQSLLIITGPNMGGKSTYLRQVALISIMAQAGSFVPAEAADLFIVDRIFTRIGAGDNVALGKSTFLVEMEETATICTQARAQSLVILDEVGRGTSTFDGMALAQAIIEYIAQYLGARCLFATHYHELTMLQQTIPVIANYHADCKKVDDDIVFLHTIIPGVAQSSFGVDVARLAQVPAAITTRAAQLLKAMERHETTLSSALDTPPQALHCEYCVDKKVMEWLQRVRNLDLDGLTPRQAYDILWELKKQV